MATILDDKELKDYRKFMEEAQKVREERAAMGLPLSSEHDDGDDEDAHEGGGGREDDDDLFEDVPKDKSSSDGNEESLSSD
jgi:hypothetical protein